MTSNARKYQFMKLFVSIIRNCLYQSLGLPNVSQQEGVLGLKMRSPITVILERGEGFFRWLRVKSFPHFKKEQIKRRNAGASNIQADADGRSDLLTLPDERNGRCEGERTFLSGRSPTIDVIRLNLIALCLQQSYRRYNLTKLYL